MTRLHPRQVKIEPLGLSSRSQECLDPSWLWHAARTGNQCCWYALLQLSFPRPKQQHLQGVDTNADSRAPLQPNWVSLCTLSSPSGASAHLRFEKHSSSVAHGPWGWHANSYKLMVIPSHLALHGSSHVPRSFQVKFPLRREIRTHPWLF